MVHILNESLALDIEKEASTPFIGVLDIYGFEHFELNSFEQFCINYANEKLQRHFNRHVFQLEQEEYQKEGLSNWTFVNFQDNQPCIELIEGKPGVLNVLDDVCRSQRSDEEFVNMLYQNFYTGDATGPKKPKSNQDKEKAAEETNSPKAFFDKPRFDNRAFSILHYAHKVTYKVNGFVEKNKDTVPDEIQEVLKASKSEFMNRIFTFAEEEEEAQKKKVTEAATNASAKKTGAKIPIRRGTIAQRKPTLGAEFRVSLIELMKKIASTETHYIRCIKPNENKKAWEFDANMVVAQLRACGVLETIRISCAGYPSRVDIPEFINTYAILSKNRPTSYEDKEDVRNFVRQILQEAIPDSDKYQVGQTMVFFLAGMLAYMHKLRIEKRNDSALYIQKISRMFIARHKFLHQRRMAVKIQTAFRAFLARRAYNELRESKAATTIQRYVRGYLARSHYATMIQSAIIIQTNMRRCLARKKYIAGKKERAAIQIQSVFRGYLAHQRYLRKLNAVIRTQAYLRTKAAQKEFHQGATS